MEPAPPIDLVIHGDSRSRLLEAPALCARLRRPLARCENLSSTSGDWVTTWGLQQKVTPLLTDLYQFTMAYAYWKAGKHLDRAVSGSLIPFPSSIPSP